MSRKPAISNEQLLAFHRIGAKPGHEFGVPPMKKLSLMIRPAFIAPKGKTLVWGDFSNIEARVLPWLSDSRGGEAKLDIFRATDADPVNNPDVYCRTAAGFVGMDDMEFWSIYKNDKHEKYEWAKDARQGQGKVPELACIAEGQKVLTDKGLVPIEKVTIDMRVWDGQSFVKHSGLVYRGFKDVYEYEGLVATLDHVVWTEDGAQCEFGYAARSGKRILKSGAGGKAVRAGDDHIVGTSIYPGQLAGGVRSRQMRGMRGRTLDLPIQFDAGRVEGLPSLLAATAGASVAISQVAGSEATLHQPEEQAMAQLRRSRCGVQVPQRSSRLLVGRGKYRASQRSGARPEEQRGSLRTWELAVGNAQSAEPQQTGQLLAGRLRVQGRGVAVRVAYGTKQNAPRDDAGGNSIRRSLGGDKPSQELARYRGKARVYDLLNAGPLNRFTVSDCLVHNCGFGGALGAIQAMARNLGVYIPDAEALDRVQKWRSANSWAPLFWGKHNKQESYGIWGAICRAVESPGSVEPAGRVYYMFDSKYLGGTLFCALPCGRLLTYPQCKWEWREVENKKTKEKEEKFQLTYRKGYGRAAMWGGKSSENITQAFAATMLREVLKRIEFGRGEFIDQRPDSAELVMHTHDEIVMECDEDDMMDTARYMHAEMTWNPDYADGLPLAAEISSHWSYSKTVKELHL